MTDLKLQLTNEGMDLVLENEDLALDEGLVTPVVVSLYSDARRTVADIGPSDEDDDPRGAWFDNAADRFGSLLWLHYRDTSTTQNAERMRTAIDDALTWLVRDNIAERIETTVVSAGSGRIVFSVKIVRGSAIRYPSVWENIQSQRLECAPGVVVNLMAFAA